MSFNVIVAATDLMCKEKKYAIMIADTIIIREDEPEILTGQASSKYDEISYSLQVWFSNSLENIKHNKDVDEKAAKPSNSEKKPPSAPKENEEAKHVDLRGKKMKLVEAN